MANDNRYGTWGNLSRLTPWLLIAVAAALAGVCVWAEARGKLYLAQGTYIAIVFMLAAGLIWWRKYHLEP